MMQPVTYLQYVCLHHAQHSIKPAPAVAHCVLKYRPNLPARSCLLGTTSQQHGALCLPPFSHMFQAHVANRTPSLIPPCGSRRRFAKIWISLPIVHRPRPIYRLSSMPLSLPSHVLSTIMASSRNRSLSRQSRRRCSRD